MFQLTKEEAENLRFQNGTSKEENMSTVNAVPAENTNFQLLVALVPDIEKRLDEMRKERPEFFEEIRRRAVKTEGGWTPLGFWQGAF